MRLGAKGYRVTLLDRLDRRAGADRRSRRTATASTLGPTIVDRAAWFQAALGRIGRDFAADVDLRPVDPKIRVRWRERSVLPSGRMKRPMTYEVRRLSPRDVPG